MPPNTELKGRRRGLPNIILFFLNNSQQSSLVYIINEMEYQLEQSICKWATAFVLCSFLTSQNVSGYYVMFSTEQPFGWLED